RSGRAGPEASNAGPGHPETAPSRRRRLSPCARRFSFRSPRRAHVVRADDPLVKSRCGAVDGLGKTVSEPRSTCNRQTGTLTGRLANLTAVSLSNGMDLRAARQARGLPESSVARAPDPP